MTKTKIPLILAVVRDLILSRSTPAEFIAELKRRNRASLCRVYLYSAQAYQRTPQHHSMNRLRAWSCWSAAFDLGIVDC